MRTGSAVEAVAAEVEEAGAGEVEVGGGTLGGFPFIRKGRNK